MSATADMSILAGQVDSLAVKFPITSYSDPMCFASEYFAESARAAASIRLADFDRAASLLLAAYSSGATVFACGNGGSAAVANHLQCDHLKAVRTQTDLMPRVVSLSSNVELLTAIANDISYEDVFAYQLESQARPGDVLIVISSSGRSPNIIRALDWAKGHDVRTIALTGFDGGAAYKLSDVAIHVDCKNYGVVEDLHQATMHALAQYIRQSRMTVDGIMTASF